MNADATTTYLIPEPFQAALKIVRRALGEQDIRIVEELDLPRIMAQMLGIHLPPFRVLMVSCPRLLQGAVDESPFLLAFFPLYVVTAAHGHYTEVHVAGPSHCEEALPRETAGLVDAAHTRLQHVLGAIAMRQPVCSLA